VSAPEPLHTLSPDDLPPLYARWMDELLRAPIPHESEATCADCVMLAREGETAIELFSPATKCCTYLPDLPNFLCGRILGDDDPALAIGRRSLEERISTGIAVTPLGVGRRRSYQLLYDNTPGAFGHASTLRCPHYVTDEGRCGVWRHRNSTCSTWFCKHVRGAAGHRFWKTMQQLLAAMERNLAKVCVVELDLDPDAIAALFPPAGVHDVHEDRVAPTELDGRADLGAYRAAWGRWFGKERELYRHAAERVSAMSLADVLACSGPDVSLFARVVKDRHRALISTEQVDAVELGLVQIRRHDADRCHVAGYSHYDPLELPSAVVESLHHFDGRPVAEVLAEIERDKGVTIDAELVSLLLDFEILKPRRV
jgi:hypothetical protein